MSMKINHGGKQDFLIFWLVFLICFFVISFVGVVHFAFAAKPAKFYRLASTRDASGAPASFADLVDRLKPAVVNISTSKVIKSGGNRGQRSPFGDDFFDRFFGGEEFFRRFFGDSPQRQFKQRSLGSGFIISRDGYIFTNNHVVEKADKIKVRLSNGKEYDARVVGKDAKTDIALIKIKAANHLPVVEFGDSDRLRVGDWVIAIGNPFGLEQTVTVGIVSAKGRVIGAGPYDNFIQTDASINPGNSGGPLFSVDGKVVGINTAIVAQGQGIGFAIPVNMAKEMLPELKTRGKVTRGWLGISVQDITEDMAQSLKIKGKEGALVADVVQGDPADRAGIRSGDVIAEIDGRKVKDAHDLLRLVAAIHIGKKVDIKVIRDGKINIFPVVITERKDTTELSAKKGLTRGGYFGMTVQDITPEVAEYLGLSKRSGVVVTGVKEGSPADEAGVKPKDIIIQVNKVKIASLKDYKREMSKKDARENVLLLVKRGKATIYIAIRKS
jgi:serine protease Do